MKILILTRNISDYDADSKQKSETQIKEENFFGYGRVNIKDALGVKKILNGTHEVKILSLNDDVYSQIEEEKPDVVFNLCDDGFRGDQTLEPHVAAMLDILDIPYTGSNYFTLALCQHKVRTKDILTFNNILTPRFQLFTAAERKLDRTLKFPMIVKPVREDGSLGIRERSVVNNEGQLKDEVDHVVTIFKQEALVEEYIEGREFSVSLIGNRRPIVLPVAEIDFSGMPAKLPKIVSYRAKWVKQSLVYKNTPIICPANIDEKMTKFIEDAARKCYRILGCRGYARVDFRYDEGDKKLYALEVNPNPDVSEEFELAESAKAAGISYSDLILKILDFALEKRY